MANPPDNPVDFAALRAAADPFFLGFLLALVSNTRHLAPSALARLLGCPAEALPRLYLCRAPRASAPEFKEDVGKAAALAGCDAAALAALVREAQSVAALRPGSAGRVAPRLLAARDRQDEGGKGESGHV